MCKCLLMSPDNKDRTSMPGCASCLDFARLTEEEKGKITKGKKVRSNTYNSSRQGGPPNNPSKQTHRVSLAM